MKALRVVLPIVALSVILLSGRESHAAPATRGFELAVGFRYGEQAGDVRWNPFGPGVGLDGGYTFDGGFHLGVMAEYFLGTTREAGDLRMESNNLQLLAVPAYDIGLGDHLVLRPELAIGVAKISDETCGGGSPCSHGSYSAAVLAPGARVLYVIPHPTLFVDLRYELYAHEFVGAAVIFTVGLGF